MQLLSLTTMSKTSFDSVNKIWSGSKLPSIFNSDITVGYLILNVLQSTPDAITQISADTGVEVTCRQMYERTINIASYLQELNYHHGDVVGIIASNSDDLAPTVFACLTLGLPISSLSPAMSESEMIFVYSNTKPKLIFCDADIVKKVEAVVRELPTDCLIFTLSRNVENFKFIEDRNYDIETFRIPLFDSSSLALILATSGTTSRPKQVCKSHKAIIAAFTSPWKSKLSSQEIWLSLSTIYWITGVSTLLLGTLYGGKRIITTRPFQPNLILEMIEKYRVTTTIILPSFLAALLDCKGKTLPNSSLKIMFVGGLPLSKQLFERAKFIFPTCNICSTYASTEGGILAMNLSNMKCESVGQLYGNVDMKVLDDSGNCLGVYEDGELIYRTPGLFSGYFNDPVETAKTIKDGWISSGDVGYFDSEGFLFIKDRKKNLFKYDNVKVSANELEIIINEINDVSVSCVVAVYQDDIANDLIFAFVVKKSHSTLTEENIEEYVREKVVDEKRIRGGVHFVDCLPMTVSGKVHRGEVKNLAIEKYQKNKFQFRLGQRKIEKY